MMHTGDLIFLNFWTMEKVWYIAEKHEDEVRVIDVDRKRTGHGRTMWIDIADIKEKVKKTEHPEYYL